MFFVMFNKTEIQNYFYFNINTMIMNRFDGERRECKM